MLQKFILVEKERRVDGFMTHTSAANTKSELRDLMAVRVNITLSNNLNSQSLYTMNSIQYPCKLPSTLGFETQCQTYFSNLQDGNTMEIVDNLDIIL